jgi:hypothetical protein
MDDLVRQAMQKWPNVPDCYGWLGLDARGQWWMRDAPTQALGAFPKSKGSLLQHDKLIAFISRNYACDERGCWYFQNGPQRVFVELESTPWVWRVEPQGHIVSHTGEVAELIQAVQDERGHLYFQTQLGLGLVHTQDVQRAVQLFENKIEQAVSTDWQVLPQHYHFVRSPQAQASKIHQQA